MDVLVVTGGIGSGKSEVCSILKDVYGCAVYEADSKVKDLYGNHPTLLNDIEAALGEKFRDSEGHFSPSLLSVRIFSDSSALEEVEKLVFPTLLDDFHNWKRNHTDDKFVVFESATILEKPFFKDFGDKVILVDAPFETRLLRASERDNVTKGSIQVRMMNQKLMNRISEGKESPEVDAVIYNYDGLEELRRQVVLTVNELYGLKTDIN